MPRLLVILAAYFIVVITLQGASHNALAQTPNCTAVVDSLEVTQAIQTMHSDSLPNNIVHLVAGRGTTVRVYLDTYPIGCGPVNGVSGLLRLQQGGNVFLLALPDNGSTSAMPLPIDPAQRRAENRLRRGVENGTLNYTFSVPTSSAGSNAVQMSVKLTTAPTFTTPETYNFVTLTGNHQYTRIGSVKIKANGLLPDPQKIAPGVSDRFIKGGMPFPVGSPQHILFDETVYPYVGNPIGVTEAPAVLLGLEKLRKNMKPCVGYLHGWAKISQMPLNGVSCGGSRTIDCHVGMSKDKEENMQRVFSHEFTHEILDNNGHPSDPTYIDRKRSGGVRGSTCLRATSEVPYLA